MSENPEDHPSKRRRILPSPKPNEDQEDNEIEGIFQGMRIYIHDRINPARRRVLRSLITQHGGINSINADENVTHILVDENILAGQLCHDLQWRWYIPQNIHVLMVGWVSSSIHANRILNGRHFYFSCPRGPVVTMTLDSSTSDNVEEDVEASVEDNGPRERKFAKPTHPRSAYENPDNDERKFWSPLEEGSTYDDNNYNCETTCDDEWLKIPLPDPPVCDLPSETAGNVEDGVEKDGVNNDDLENNVLADDASTKESKSKEDESAQDAGVTRVKKANKKKNCNVFEDAAVCKPGPSTSSNVNLPPAKTPMVPFDQRPDNTVGRLSRLRLKMVHSSDGNGKKWVVVNMNKPNENEPSLNEAVPISTMQENLSKKEYGSAFTAVEHNLPGATTISSNSVSTKHCPLEIPSLNGEDVPDLPIPKDKLSDNINLSIETMNQHGHKRKNETSSSEELNEANQERTALLKNEKGIPISSKKKKHKRKQSKHKSIPILSDEQETTDQKEQVIQKKRKKARLQKRKDENTSDSTSSDKQDEITEKFSLKKAKPEKACLSPYVVQGETTNLVELSPSKGKFPRKKPRKSISTPASPVSEGIKRQFPHISQKKNSSAPASPNILDKSLEKLSYKKYKKMEPGKNTSASALPNAESWNFKMDENILHSNPNSTNAIFNDTSANTENMPSSSTSTIANKKDEIRKYVTNFFATNLPSNDEEYKKEKKRKRSIDNELHFTENPEQSYSHHTNIPSSVPLNLDFTMNISKEKHSVCQQTPTEGSDFNESVFQTNVAPSQSSKSTLVKSSEPRQGNKIPTLAESNISAESTSSQVTRSVIQFAKSALNGSSSASSVSHLIDLQNDRKAVDESVLKDSPKDGASVDKSNIVLGEEIKSNKIAVDVASKAECIPSTIEELQDKLDSTPASPTCEDAIRTIADLCNKVDSKVDSFPINQVKIYPIELQCALNFDVELRISELFFCPKTNGVVAEINFLKAELERRKYGSGSWQIKEFNDFIAGKSESKIAEEKNIKKKVRIGYWESSIDADGSDAEKPISFVTDTDRLSRDEPINVSTINQERSHETPVIGRDLIFPLPEPLVSTSDPEVVSTDVSIDGKKVVKHYLSPLCPNFKIIHKLQHLYEFFKKAKDIWRMHAYEQAIFALGKYPTLIRSLREAQSIKGVGNTIAFKVWEIIRTGNLQEIDEFCNNEWVTARNLLTKGWGITPKRARGLYRENLSNVNQVWVGGNLSRSQRLGLKYYEHLSKKMTRAEADEIAAIVDNFVKLRNKKVVVEACSTIRRNKKLCGHISILVILQRGVEKGHRLLDDTVAALHREGYIIDDLIRHEENGNQCKYSGLFQINQKARCRRLDLTIVPYIEQVCARFFLTGPSYFLRAIVKHAERQNMILDEHCVRLNYLDVYGRIMKVSPVHLSSEEDLFTMLELPYRSPEQRDIIPFSTVVKK